MDYLSNLGLTAPDLRPQFPHMWGRVMGHSFGHTVYSDWADKPSHDPIWQQFKECGFWTRDEAAILYHVAKQFPGRWLDIGSHTGWTAAHILAAGASDVYGVDPAYNMVGFTERAQAQAPHLIPCPFTSHKFFSNTLHRPGFSGIVIDGSHEDDEPFRDAVKAASRLATLGVILFHDFVGKPVQDAVEYLIARRGFTCRLYLTPHVVAVCYRHFHGEPEGGFIPPIHLPEQGLVEQDLFKRWPERDWSQYS